MGHRYISEIDKLLQTLHTQICQAGDRDAVTKEMERKKYEQGIYPLRDSASAPRDRVKRWQDE